MIPQNICVICKQYRGLDKCRAFPNGIPDEVLIGKVDHRKPYRGDNGIQFKPITKAKGK